MLESHIRLTHGTTPIYIFIYETNATLVLYSINGGNNKFGILQSTTSIKYGVDSVCNGNVMYVQFSYAFHRTNYIEALAEVAAVISCAPVVPMLASGAKRPNLVTTDMRCLQQSTLCSTCSMATFSVCCTCFCGSRPLLALLLLVTSTESAPAPEAVKVIETPTNKCLAASYHVNALNNTHSLVRHRSNRLQTTTHITCLSGPISPPCLRRVRTESLPEALRSLPEACSSSTAMIVTNKQTNP